ncbi:MAG TPA: iron uptake transporter permease EfeU [Candidatus Limnocylindrales bacterium]|nr:iron uptake transporter permease EfeU [Candidatus Limnocylindrales bacterium]
MEIGSFTSGLLTGLREGVEAALIVSIVLAYLARTGNLGEAPRVWIGVGLAVAASLLVGVIIFTTVREFQEPYEQLFEAATLIVAASVVTWMLFWMRRTAASVKGELQAAVDRAVTRGGAFALSALVFVAVIREGIETSLFLVGQASAASSGSEDGALSVLLGAVVGLGIATLLGYGFYRGSRRINLARFFRWTGVALVFIAAGLLAHAVHELIEIGAINVGTQTAFDLSGILPHEAGGTAGGPILIVGELLAALFGYTSTPEVSRLVVYAVYVVAVLALYLRPVRPVAAPSRPAPNAA